MKFLRYTDYSHLLLTVMHLPPAELFPGPPETLLLLLLVERQDDVHPSMYPPVVPQAGESRMIAAGLTKQ